MRLFFKFFISLMIGTIIAGIGFWFFNNESLPEGTSKAEADQVAQQMMRAVNKEAWDEIKWVSWTFRGAHDFLWDKKRDMVEVKWDENRVLLHTKSITGKAYQNGQLVEDSSELIQAAWSYFCNDSFWLNPVVKAFDSGTERSLVTLEDGRKGLKVAYTSGGVTPGDSYVWILDETNRPVAWKMWTKIIPIGGVETSWENWQTLPGGAMVASMHKTKGPALELTNIKAGNTLAEIGRTADPFKEL